MSQHSAESRAHAERPDADAVLRDDVLVDALAKGVLPMEHYTDEFIRGTLRWRDDINTAEYAPTTPLSVEEMMSQAGLAAPLMTSVEDETRVLAIPYNDFAQHESDAPHAVPTQRQTDTDSSSDEDHTAAHTRPRNRFAWIRRPVLLLSACAAIAVASLGSVAAANVAEPGSVLWPVTKAINPDRAHSLEARNDAETAVTQAREALDEGDLTEAQKHLQEAEEKTGDVREQDGKDDLEGELSSVKKELDDPERKTKKGKDEEEPTPSPSAEVTPSTSPSTSPSPSTSIQPSTSPTPSENDPTPSGSSTPAPSE